MEETERQSDPCNNNASSSANVEDIQDSINDVTNISTPEEEPKPVDNDSAKDVTYTSSAHISVLSSYSDCDLRNQEGADRFKAEIEECRRMREEET